MTEARPRLFDDETKTAIIDKIGGIDKLTEDEFDTLITRVKSLRRTLLESLRTRTSAQDVTTFIMISLNFAVIVALT